MITTYSKLGNNFKNLEKARSEKKEREIIQNLGLFKFKWHRIILDECHHIKVNNLKSQMILINLKAAIF